MARFFIDRPIFAWVIALLIAVIGGISMTQLPIAQYPLIAPPSIIVTATYPGATAAIIDQSVTSLIEQELNGAEGLYYVESQSQANGQAQITASFRPGTNPDLAQVDVQNRLKRIESRLPDSVRQQGVQVNKATSNFLLFTSLSSSDGSMGPIELGDYIARNVIDELKRVPGVGQATFFGTERAMRIWFDPAKLTGYNLTPTDVTNAIAAQNAQVASGAIGDLPSPDLQQIAASVTVTGQLGSPEEFGEIVLRANADGSTVRLHDVARIELGAQVYDRRARLGGQPTSAVGIQLTPTANALATAKAIRAKLAELAKFFPPSLTYTIPYDSSKFVEISIYEVFKTLIEAIFLVFLVMYLFLQNLRATLIPTIVVPVALLGSFATMLAFGFSINVLTMFGLVLAIGILVDDAIVVVENVERIMSQEGLSPRDATRKAMNQITGAIVGISLVLVAVFIPMAFFSGAVGGIYRQFSLSMVASMLFSTLMALTLAPALCASLLKPVVAGHHVEKRGPFGWFNRTFAATATRYQGMVANLVRRTGRYLMIYAALLVCAGVLYVRLPTSFLPVEDQGFLITNLQLPPGASAHRTSQVLTEVEKFFVNHPAIDQIIAVTGFSFSGSGQNAGLVFASLKPWDERDASRSSQAMAAQANDVFSHIRDASVFTVNPPPIRELGNATGFTFRLQDRGGLGRAALLEARNQLLALAAKSPVVKGVRPEGLEDTPQLELAVDRTKANALGVPFDAINNTLSAALGSAYVNDFPNRGRLQRVIVQADALSRMRPEDLGEFRVRSSHGELVPMSAFTTTKWVSGPVQAIRYNGYPAMRISGDAAPTYSTGEAMLEMERLSAQLQAGIGYEWTGQSSEEKTSGAQAPVLFSLSILVVFLCLAALYESWSIPAAVILVVPLGILGALLGTLLRDLPNDVYFKVGLIAIIGLSAKNAILIIEFAKDLQLRGRSAIEAVVEAVHLRFRPILMTSLAFILGVLPLVIAHGAGSASQRAIGTAVMGGMISATVLAVFLVPVFYVVIRRFFPATPPLKPVSDETLPTAHPVKPTTGGTP
ncbi:MAG TPA: efflux RND transporter permease subunit [Planctomycetota bacterium]|nr:efflux RND transporter permease subunit [Planctomycetota bacterium]